MNLSPLEKSVNNCFTSRCNGRHELRDVVLEELRVDKLLHVLHVKDPDHQLQGLVEAAGVNLAVVATYLLLDPGSEIENFEQFGFFQSKSAHTNEI